jgi:GntR family transcriptional repressor for pyruvate dehydrogenase complex
MTTPSVLPSALSPTEVVEELLTLIRAQRLSPGDRLPSIRQLSVRFGVRAHVVRDALLQAQLLGYVQVRPRSRAIVQSLRSRAPGSALTDSLTMTFAQGDHHLFHLLEARQLLECEVARQAARRRRLEDLLPVREALHAMNAITEPDRRPDYVEHDIRFHLAIARVADNPVLLAMLKPLLDTLRPFLSRLPFEADCRDRTQRSHAQIYRALVAGDAEIASDEMQDHLKLAYDNLLGEVRTLPV